MSLYSSLVRPLLFRLDPERVHNAALSLLSTGLVGSWRYDHPILKQELFGSKFPNPLGLAAGFDKNAEVVGHWPNMGFGSVEIGTVTFHGQPGNDKPRLFRLPDDLALINRMGFNNDGAEKIAKRLVGVHSTIPVGINLGKSKVTPLEEAAQDYVGSFQLLRDHGSYFVINVSSPNTPGLRTLQDKGPLLSIVNAIRSIDSIKPLFVKVAPDLDFAAVDEVIEVAHEGGLTGIIASNTTLCREGLRTATTEAGGLSGLPLRSRSNEVLSHLYRNSDRSMILIGVGGVFNGQDIYDKMALGAHLVQVYTGWVYAGLEMPSRSLRTLVRLMGERGIPNLAALRGSAHRP